MKLLVKQFLDKQLSRRGFFKGMMALGFSVPAIDSVLTSLAYADEPATSRGVSFEGTGAEVLLEVLKSAGVEYIFNSNSTGQYSLYDGLANRPDMKLILAVQEGQAVSMAQGYELASGRPGAVFIPGVGVPHASSNLYNAWKDRSAVIVFTDSGNSMFIGRDMFEQVDNWLEPLGQFTKWSWYITHANRISEMARKAIKLAGTPPGGPVYIRIPSNLLAEQKVRSTIYPQSTFTVPLTIIPDQKLIEEAARLLIEAQTPLINVGGEVTRARANDDLIRLAELLSIPVSQGVSCYGDFPFSHPLFAGFYGMGPVTYATGIDAFLNLGALMPDPGFVTNPVPQNCKVIHARIEYDNIANIYPTDVAIAAGVKETIQALTGTVQGMLTASRIEAIQKERKDKLLVQLAESAKKREEEAKGGWNGSPLSWERLSAEMDKVLEDDACIVSELDARDPYFWMSFAQGRKTLIGQTTGFALGWGVGAALGVKIARPDSQVVCLVGDGSMLFGQLESLWSYARYHVPVIIVVFNNRGYDGPRNRMFMLSRLSAETKKDMACYLGDPDVDFVGIARGFGIKGELISRPDQVKPAMKRAVQATRDGEPYLIDAILAQRGSGAGTNWHPAISIAAARKRKV